MIESLIKGTNHQHKSKGILPTPKDYIKLVLELVRSLDFPMKELSPEREQDVISNILDFTNLAIRQIQSQNSIEVCAQTLWSIQESIMSMNTRLNRMEAANFEACESEYKQLPTMSASTNVKHTLHQQRVSCYGSY